MTKNIIHTNKDNMDKVLIISYNNFNNLYVQYMEWMSLNP